MLRARWVLVLVASSAALAAGCGGSKQSGSGAGGTGSGGGDCKSADKALTDAARSHVGDVRVATDGVQGDVDRVTVEVCRTTDNDAKATVTVYGMHDKSIRDVRHQLRLIKVGGLWQITDDLDARTCQKGHGQQDFSGFACQ